MGNPAEKTTGRLTKLILRKIREKRKSFLDRNFTEWKKELLRQIGVAHQIAVALAGGAAAFIEGPNNQALATATIAGSEHAFHVSRVLFKIGFDVSAEVAFNFERIEQRLFGAEKAHREQNQLDRPKLFSARNFFGDELAFFIPFPLDLDSEGCFHLP